MHSDQQGGSRLAPLYKSIQCSPFTHRSLECSTYKNAMQDLSVTALGADSRPAAARPAPVYSEVELPVSLVTGHCHTVDATTGSR